MGHKKKKATLFPVTELPPVKLRMLADLLTWIAEQLRKLSEGAPKDHL